MFKNFSILQKNIIKNINPIRIINEIGIINMNRKMSTFLNRHIGITEKDKIVMLKVCNSSSIDNLIEQATNIPKKDQLDLYIPKTANNEYKAQEYLQNILDININVKSYLGQGYYDCILPHPIKRHILESAKWYSSYTPYQAEISQGRLESQYNYQTVIQELTGLSISNASLLDEASASSEVLNLCHNYYKGKRNIFLHCDKIHPQVLDVLKTKAELLNLKLIPINIENENNKKNKKNKKNINLLIEKEIEIEIEIENICGFYVSISKYLWGYYNTK